MHKTRVIVGTFLFIASSVCAGRLATTQNAPMVKGGSQQGGLAATDGPDVIVGSLPNISKYGTVGGISAYAIGTTSCNVGDEILKWCDTNVPGFCTDEEHPVIGQNVYRLKDGRLEQVGMSWLKHGFCALAQTLCSPCTSDPFGCDALGIGCSDPYDSSLNGQQSGLGPRSQVNPSTGVFPYPFSAPSAPPTIGRRVQINVDDLDPALNTGALYFGEGHYVTKDDATAGNDNNNASYRRITVGSFSSGSWTLSLTGPTIQQKAAINAWKDHGLGVNIPDPDVFLVNVDIAEDGRFTVAYKVSQVDDTTWHYEYAILNLNSDRAAGSWTVPVPEGVTVTNVDQHIINHHSGEPYSTELWSMANVGGVTSFTGPSFDVKPDGNALRWGTMFNFRFDADQPPVEVQATLGLFKPGTAENPLVTVLGPAAPEPTGCPSDLNGDGFTDGADQGLLLAAWDTPNADLNGDGTTDGADHGLLIAAWGPCPE